MQSRISLKWPALIISIAGIALFLAVIFFSNFNLPVLGSYTYTAKPIRASGLPIRLKIPKINVDATVESVGLTPQGEVGVPKVPVNTAWFNLGPRPGEKGSSVIDGHFGWWKNGTPAVFDNLYKLRKGDKLYVEDEKGVTTTFVVRESRKYDPKADASDVFGLSDGKSHLNLVTCDGTWDKIAKSYSQRLVVFTDKEYNNPQYQTLTSLVQGQ